MGVDAAIRVVAADEFKFAGKSFRRRGVDIGAAKCTVYSKIGSLTTQEKCYFSHMVVALIQFDPSFIRLFTSENARSTLSVVAPGSYWSAACDVYGRNERFIHHQKVRNSSLLIASDMIDDERPCAFFATFFSDFCRCY